MTLASDDVAPGVVRFERVLPTGWSLSMLLVRLPGGGVLVHSPTWLGDETFAAVEAVGAPRALFAPNHFHHLSLERFRTRYPDAPAIASSQAKKRLATQGHQGLAPLSDAAAMLPAGARFLECEGTKSGEAWLLLPAAGGAKTGGTLIVSDAFFNVTRDVTGLMGFGLRMLKTCPGLCIGQTFPWLALADRARYRAWADDVFAREQPALLLPSHGEPAGAHAGVPLHERCRALLRERLLEHQSG